MNSLRSEPPGFTGKRATDGVLYDGSCYPERYRGAYFLMNHVNDWVRVIEVDDNDNDNDSR